MVRRDHDGDGSRQAGDRVTAGQRIARINPDSATNGGVAPHLHLSVMPREYNPDAKIDPIPWLAGALEPPARTIFGPDISNNNGVVDLDRVKDRDMGLANVRQDLRVNPGRAALRMTYRCGSSYI